ncbi:hypothetical protein BC332_12103 [Capsicum chinense]|nr:hypothetical protein BC332_12103 [Capsicum chinense]
MISMDLNALPIQPEDDDELFGRQLEDQERSIILHSDERADYYVKSAVEISRGEREERIQGLKRQHPAYPCQPRMRDEIFQTKRQKPSSRLPPDWRKEGIKHVKIQCRGRGAVPDNESVNLFVYEVSQFLARQKHAKKHILLHCTHGHNRTGFMIVHYLMRTLSISVSQAIKIFSDARPPGIYKPDYIDALYALYHEKKPEMVVCPPTPEWKRSSELDLNGNDDEASLIDNREAQVVMSNDDVLGDAIPQDQQNCLRQLCYQALKMTESHNFPAHIQSLLTGTTCSY